MKTTTMTMTKKEKREKAIIESRENLCTAVRKALNIDFSTFGNLPSVDFNKR